MGASYLVGYQGKSRPLVGLEEEGQLYSLNLAQPTLDYLLANVRAAELLATLRSARGEALTEHWVNAEPKRLF